MDIKTSPEAIGLRIKELRKKNNETQYDLANAIKCNQNNISKIEKGGSLTSVNLIAIANHYNVSLDYLCKGEGGIDLIDTLTKYIHYKFKKCNSINFNAKKIHIPLIEINSSFYNYLRQISLAKSTSEMPKEIRENWINQANEEFIKEIEKDNYDNYASFYIIEESVLNNNSDISSQLENLISE
ncbi:MAG: helix-turn-helix transcriptional regulator [Lachnospiraceae bacterium]|nr:helix-turn-helix transcriptional regulator [Lachnospiraceae bacterium]